MPELDPKIAELEARLDSLVRTQIDFQQEITTIRRELTKLRGGFVPPSPQSPPPPVTQPLEHPVPPPPTPPIRPETPRPQWPTGESSRYVPPPAAAAKVEKPYIHSSPKTESAFAKQVSDYKESAQSDLEKFIGENLISKIGIIVLVLGVGIGAKYAIDNGWISPLMRIVFGYVMGFGLLGFAAKLKEKYLNFSSVLLSGGMAILYFVTYFAYAYYGLMPQLAAFIVMAMFTVFTVAAAIFYNRQVIAHIGLVGAYAVPFLLSDNSGNYAALFTYMSVINTGILAISVKKYWKPLFYTSFAATWLIYLAWFVTKYTPAEHLYLALAFLGIYFSIFYAAKIVQGMFGPRDDRQENLVATIVTAIVFYAFVFNIGNMRAGVYEYAVFFSYLGAASLIILLTSFRFYGRALIFVAAPFTWMIFGVWFFNNYYTGEYFVLAGVVATVFFAIFYAATLVYRLLTDEIGLVESMALVLTNSFVFYGFGYAIIDSRENLRAYEGLFTAGHGIFHSAVAQLVNRFKPNAIDVIQVLAILIITFATIAVPVQFDGKIVTLVWSVEAVALFWFGRFRLIRLFEYFSYPLMVLASCSLVVDWVNAYTERTPGPSQFNRMPLANGEFVTALVFVAAFALIYVINRKTTDEAAMDAGAIRPFGLVVGTVGMMVLYNAFRIEVANFYHLQIVESGQVLSVASLFEPMLTRRVDDLVRFDAIWQLNYTIFFLFALAVANLRKIRSLVLASIGTILSGFALLIFVTAAMLLFYELRVSYMVVELGEPAAGTMNIAIRYISYVFAALLLGALFANSRDALVTGKVPKNHLAVGFDAILYSTIFVTASCELVNLMVQFHIPDAGKLGLSILWGVYSLVLIVIGIAWNKKHLRIAAIALLAVTLVKLFLYDIADLGTIPKTILFISLGILMLIVSFLYSKYKSLIFKVAAGEEGDTADAG
ncbi:hypothetical protein BH10ACI2_BH10ACI2_25890 [soil metagenome]